MSWYSWRWWRLAYAPHFTGGLLSNAMIKDSRGTWEPLIGGVFVLVRRSPAPARGEGE